MLVGLGAGCGPGAPAQPTGSAGPAEPQRKDLPGQYTCSFESRGETLGDAQCAIRPGEPPLRLDMSGGTHQLTGMLTPTRAGFHFVGDYSCGAGEDCNETVETDFFEQTRGTFQGVVALQTGSLLSVTLHKR